MVSSLMVQGKSHWTAVCIQHWLTDQKVFPTGLTDCTWKLEKGSLLNTKEIFGDFYGFILFLQMCYYLLTTFIYPKLMLRLLGLWHGTNWNFNLVSPALDCFFLD